jgi:hypothetical protein
LDLVDNIKQYWVATKRGLAKLDLTLAIERPYSLSAYRSDHIAAPKVVDQLRPAMEIVRL